METAVEEATGLLRGMVRGSEGTPPPNDDIGSWLLTEGAGTFGLGVRVPSPPVSVLTPSPVPARGE